MTTDERFDRIEKLIADSRAETLHRFENIDRYLLEFRVEMINRLEIIDSRQTMMIGLYQSVEARMGPLTKAILDLGAIANSCRSSSRG